MGTKERTIQIFKEAMKIIAESEERSSKKVDPTLQLAMIISYKLGASWADSHPYWISVEDELPKIGWTMSDTVVVTDGIGGLRLAWYHQDEGWHFATGLTFEPTHWMRLPQAPKKGR